MYRTLIWSTDGSTGAAAALREALGIADANGARIVAVHCDQRLDGRAGGWPALPDEDDARLRIHRQVQELRDAGVDIELVIRRSHAEAADVVAAIAKEHHADAIVCGTRGLGAFSGAILGSFTQRLLHVSPCPVVAVPEHLAAEAPARREQVTA